MRNRPAKAGPAQEAARHAKPQAPHAGAGPAVPPVGARGETDLSPGRAAPSGVHYPTVNGSAEDVDRAAVRELFSEIAVGQAAPVRTFIGALRAKTATKEWLEVCRPVMAVLFESATSLGLGDAAEPMGNFTSALELAAGGEDGKEGTIDDAARELILEAYEAMAKNFPQAFEIGAAENRRDTMLLHALLKQVNGVGIVTLDALYGAGLSSLEAISQASANELSATTGVPVPLCEAICLRLREHAEEVKRTSHLPEDVRYKERLKELLNAVMKEHNAFELIAEGAGFDDAKIESKRALRRSRNLCALKIEATLVEMGDVDRADKLRALAFDQKIESLAQFLGVRVVKSPTEQRSR